MKLRRIALITLSAITAVTAAFPALANPFKDADGNIHIQNLTANQKITIEAGGLERKIVANYCGLVLVPVPSNAAMPGSISVDGTAVDTTTLPVQSVPSCTNNVLKEARPNNFKDANGRVVIVGKTSGVQSTVVYTGVPASRSLTANACGFVRISNSVSTPAPAGFNYGGTAYTTASLPTNEPNRCIDGKKFVYTP